MHGRKIESASHPNRDNGKCRRDIKAFKLIILGLVIHTLEKRLEWENLCILYLSLRFMPFVNTSPCFMLV